MPLVTRTANEGVFFKQTTEPGGWLDGDLWSDTTANLLKLNVSGTAEEIGGLDIANIAVRHSISESITTTIAPASGEHHTFTVWGESMPSNIITMDISANRTNNVTVLIRLQQNNSILYDPAAGETFNGQMLPIRINDASDWDFTTPATVGTYIVQRIGDILS